MHNFVHNLSRRARAYHYQILRPLPPYGHWDLFLKLLVCARLIKPSSEWYLHREGYRQSAMADLLGMDPYPDLPLKGRVDGIGWGIAQEDGSTGQDLLPNINPTFEWIRLAQRVPVRVHLENVPDEVKLRVGTTTSVLVRKRTSDRDEAATVPPVPKALQ